MTESAASKRTALLIFLSVAILVTAVDLWSKEAVHEFLEVKTVTIDGKPVILDPKRHHVVIENLFWLEYNYNYGAFSGWFSKHTNVLALVSGIALVIIAGVFFVYLRKTDSPEILFSLSLGLLWGGTCGNLWDRAHLQDCLLYTSPSPRD